MSLAGRAMRYGRRYLHGNRQAIWIRNHARFAIYPFRRYLGYNDDYFMREGPEIQAYKKRLIRPEDMGSSFAYLTGLYDYDMAQELYGPCDTLEKQLNAGRDLVARAGWKCPTDPREVPGYVMDLGCGRGELSAYMRSLDIPVVPIDFATCAPRIVADTYDRFAGLKETGLINKSVRRGVLEAKRLHGDAEAVIMCESIEHFPPGEFAEAWFEIREMLTRTEGRAIIANWIDFWPIIKHPGGWDHIQTIDDRFYDGLAGTAKKTLYRRGSHMVLQF